MSARKRHALADGGRFRGVTKGRGSMVAGRPITVQVGDIEVLAQTVVVPGTEPTSAVADRVLEAFDRAQEVIVEVAGPPRQ